MEVIADALAEEIEDEPGVVEEEDGEEEDETQAEAKLAEATNAETNARNRGNGGQNRDAPNDDHLKMERGLLLDTIGRFLSVQRKSWWVCAWKMSFVLDGPL